MEQGRFFSLLLALLLVFVSLIELVVNEALLALYVAEHVLAFWQWNEVWEHLGVLLIELAEFWQTNRWLLFFQVETFQKFVYIVKDQIIFEDTNDVARFIVDEIIDHF